MADISDITAAIASACYAVLYPGGVTTPGQNSVLGLPAKVFEGWPAPQQLDDDAKNRIINVSVFPIPGATAKVPQIFEQPFVITPAVHGLSAVVGDTTVTVSGAPTSGEYLTVIVNGRKIYSRVGATQAAVLAALLADITPDFPTASVVGSVLTIPGAFSLEARIGAPATLGSPVHRQSDQVMVTVWAPDPETRNAYAAAIDVALKTDIQIDLPDTTTGIVRYERTNLSDHQQNKMIYRRDLVYSVEYKTIETFQAFEVTSVTTTTSTSYEVIQ